MITIPIAKLINTNNTAPIDPAVAKYAKIGEGVAHGMLIQIFLRNQLRLTNNLLQQ